MSPQPRVPLRGERLGQSAQGGEVPATLNSKLQNLAAQNALLEQQVEESGRARAALERALSEQRTRAAEDREKLFTLSSRIEQLEHSKDSSRGIIDDNRELRAQLEMHKVQLADFRGRAHQARTERGGDVSPPPPVHGLPSPKEQVHEENERLRNELTKSRALLGRYTAELGEIMPGMQAMLSDLHRPDGASSSSTSARGPSSVRGVAPGGGADQEVLRPTGRLSDRYGGGQVLASSLLLSSSAGGSQLTSAAGSMAAPVSADAGAGGGHVVERSSSVPSVGKPTKYVPGSSRASRPSRPSTGGSRQGPAAKSPARGSVMGALQQAGRPATAGSGRPNSLGRSSSGTGGPASTRPAPGRATSPSGARSGGAASRRTAAR